ncbi:electron transport complex protein RnfE [Natranaerovirga pectinivora]|uniref:Ion-translocating oxidoreductase complex subunit E n=1 Tax=Natranaerovirga pectinivora TaxID=682400 RepID=A0A4R3MK83_9FIRM|nr:electron transport complex subunit E [Natranaerovirga pectinivora]TCT14977.1 electron transport complex protein RnfE [Natranaerovirga pectinivora]
MNGFINRLKTGIFTENPIFIQILGMCPTLAVTTSAYNGMGMGLATMAVLIAANFVISLLRNIIPNKVRIPAFIVVIASFVTMIDLILAGYIPNLHDQLGIFIPLIVVNCVILGRAEAYASKNKLLPAVFDGVGMGLGFTLALTLIGAVRELLGAGAIFGFEVMNAITGFIYNLLGDGQLFGLQVIGEQFEAIGIFVLAPGAFFVLGFLLAIFNNIKNKKMKKA